MEVGSDTTLRECTTGSVAAHLESGDARDVTDEGDSLQVEHQLDMFIPEVRHACRRRRYLPRLARSISRFNRRNPPFDFANAFEIILQLFTVTRTDGCLQLRYLVRDQIENAAIGFSACV